MKNKIFTALFLLLLSGSTLSSAQQPLQRHKSETKRVVGSQPERRHHIFNMLNISMNQPNNPSFSKNRVKNLNALVPDFQVNGNAGPNGAAQTYPSISGDGTGNFVMMWTDERNGDSDIYGQRYSIDGIASGINFKINDDPGIALQNYPSVSSDGIGNFVVTWMDERNGDPDIYGQRYSSDGTVLGANFKVNDDQVSEWQESPSISSDSSGNFVIMWRDHREGFYGDIYGQRYSGDGSVLGANFKVNDDQGSAYQFDPAISSDGSGNFVVTWEDKRDGKGEIYGQRFSSNGSALGTNFKVNDYFSASNNKYPAISCVGNGNFVMTWQGEGNDIYGQRYSSDGSVLGTNFKVNDDYGNASQYDPAISSDSSGNYVIMWKDFRDGNPDIYGQRYSSDGSALGTNFEVNDGQGSAYQLDPSIFSDNSGNLVITWSDERNGDSDIYGQRYSSDGSVSGTNFKVNNDQGSADQWTPAISTDGSGNFVVTWEDKRNGDPDIYGQRYSSDGSVLGTNFRINDNQGSDEQRSPAISSDGSGNFVVTWTDQRNEYSGDIYGQRYSSDGSVLGTNFKVNEDQGSAYQNHPSISTDDGGNFVIAWVDQRNGGFDIYGQRYSSDGTVLGTNFQVNDRVGTVVLNYTSISTDDGGNFVITWVDRRYDYDIYGQRYSSTGSVLGTNFKVNDDQGGLRHMFPSISSTSNGNFVITWNDWRNGYEGDIYGQRYSSDGSVLGTNFKVNDDQGSAVQNYPSISTDSSGNFVITWEDRRNGVDGDIYGQCYSSDGSEMGSNFRITNTSEKNQFKPDVELLKGRLYFTWSDSRASGTGFDIWANVLDWDNLTGINDKERSQLPSASVLAQNYPNPFNPATTISYSLQKSGYVILTIYDMLGNEIQKLVNEFKEADNYSIDFDASGLSTGIYFYKLQVDGYFLITKKMILLR